MVLIVGLFAQEDKRHALELNPIGLFDKRISTAYTYFSHSTNGAIHIPIFYKKVWENEQTFTIDMAYHHFLNHKDK